MKQKIKILENGSYEVSGGVPLTHKEIVMQENGVLELKTLGKLTPGNQEKYYLCRCGKTKTPPFCDGSHLKCEFRSTEVADKADFKDRAKLMRGKTMDLLDDSRCAFARFCHRENGDVWTLVKRSDNPENKSQAIKGIKECPTGRLVAVDKQGNLMEDKEIPEIIIVEDSEKKCSAGIFVKGDILLESSDGTMYENRSKYALCRCGQSKNMPFCDASHIGIGFDANKND